MRHLFLGALGLFLFGEFAQAKTAFLQESMAVTVVASGDIAGSFDFSGPVGAALEAEPSEPVRSGPTCTAQFMFRKIALKPADLTAAPAVSKADQAGVEVWPTFKCLIKGQTKTYKMHRQYLKLSDESQKKQIQNIDQNLKNVTLEFRDLAVQKGK